MPPQEMLCARANGETFVSATMCPRLPGPLQSLFKLLFGSGLLNYWVHDHVIVLQELFAVQSSSS